RARHPAARDALRALRQRHRPDDGAARGRAGLGGQARQGRVRRARGDRGGARGRPAPAPRRRRDAGARRAPPRLPAPRRRGRRGGHGDVRVLLAVAREGDRHGLRARRPRGDRHGPLRRDPRRRASGARGEDTLLPLAREEGLTAAPAPRGPPGRPTTIGHGRQGETMSSVPRDLRYTKEHEWARIEGDRARVGITAFAQEQLGDVVFVELPKVGAKLTSMKTFGVVESVKAVSDLYAPLTGEVLEVNAELPKKPEL